MHMNICTYYCLFSKYSLILLPDIEFDEQLTWLVKTMTMKFTISRNEG